MSDKSSIFDMIGPVMIGPSSSHTAGVVRIARVGRKVIGIQPENAIITFYNSFARTFEGHGSDRAVIAGLLDMETDDERIKNSLEHAKQNNLTYVFKSASHASTMHPNTVRISMEAGKRKAEVLGISKGGGIISIEEVDGFNCHFSAQMHTLIIAAEDVRGSIAFIANLIANDNANIASMTVAREAKNRTAKLVLEMDSGLEQITVDYLNHLKWVKELIYIPNIQL